MQQLITLPGVVHSLGHEAKVAAELYAALTGRPHRQHENLEELKTGCHDVVVCLTERLSVQLMYRLYVKTETAGVPGLICAPTQIALEELCHQIASRFVRPRRTEKKRVFLRSAIDFGVETSGADIKIGGTAPASVLPALSAGASILAIWGHSNGFDLTLSLNKFACPFLGDVVPDSELSVPCQVIGKCTRFPTMPSIDDAQRKGWIVPLTSLRAEVGIILGCSMLRLRDGVIDPAYGFAAAMLRQADIGVLVTTWRLEIITDVNSLINDICSGTMVGVAVRAYNTSPMANRLKANLCLLGDPCFALPPDSNFSLLPQAPTNSITMSGAVGPSKGREYSEVELLLAAALDAPKAAQCFDMVKAEALRSALFAYASATAGLSDLSEESAGRDVDLALLDFLRGAHGRLDKFLDRFGSIDILNETDLCPSCLAPARAFWMAFTKYAAKPRKILRCACCDDVSNLPAGWDVTPDFGQIGEGLILLSGVPREAQVSVRFTNLWAQPYQEFTCPPPDGGRLVIQLPDRLPLMPMLGSILIIRRLEIGTIQFKFRSLPSGGYSAPLALLHEY